MRVVVPFAAAAPKTRLGPALSAAERVEFSRVLLADVLGAIDDTDRQPPVTVLSTEPVDVDASVSVDDRPLSDAVNAVFEDRVAGGDEAVAVVMSDLALATPAALDRLFGADGDVVLAPGRGGGTNAVVSRHPGFRVDYHGASIRDHRRAAGAVGADLTEVDSYRLGIDVDEPEDLAEVLLHGRGAAPTWLRERGFELDVSGGRVSVARE
ncbi:MAG: 2-phospho-L-lactate guanylyltransferase [Haloarculaceae archaeon]